ncbi:MAG: hypothetical protein ACQKBY_08550 [Verrucomicrobiales bacterium]
MKHFSQLAAALVATSTLTAEEPKQLSGIYPSLAMFNNEGECGTGAVVPWADRLWVVTYAPHQPTGSTDKLYEITPDLKQIVRPESIGGTPANRMIHKESGQLFIGPHAISAEGEVRTIPYKDMFGRHTGNARSLSDPAGKILYATMEEGIYEVDTKTLAVTELWADTANKKGGRKSGLPGYHGKGFYSGQGVYVYSNNGEYGKEAQSRPDVPSGGLGEWDGEAEKWTLIRRNQFTEVTGPGGIHGNPNPETDPIWTVGWDHRSLLMGVREPESGWTFYRLPKGSHSYDGAHGWNTEWPRIRDIGEDDYLMTMHGTFWKFPKTFTSGNSAGITPRSNYLKVIGDFALWQDRLVFGCDDTAQNEFLNTRKAKGHVASPQSQSNLWFVSPEKLDQLGPVIGRGAVWVKEDVAADTPSDPFLFSGYQHRALHLHHQGEKAVTLSLEIDQKGDGNWTPLRELTLEPKGYQFLPFTPEQSGSWIRLHSASPLTGITAAFAYHNADERSPEAAELFQGIAQKDEQLTGGIIRARNGDKRNLAFAALDHKGQDLGSYTLTADLELVKSDDAKDHAYTKEKAAIPDISKSLSIDAASVIYTDDSGKKWRLPKGDPSLDKHPLGGHRIAREVATERDFFNAHGTFYELPARNAGGFIKVRPVATHNRLIHDFCSYRGLLIFSGISTQAPADNPHIIKSEDGKVALWAGAVDDVWQFGKPRGQGGPWLDTPVKKGQPSDPYLMTAYDEKILQLRSSENAKVTAQIDLTGEGNWADYQTFELEAGHLIGHEFPAEFQAYWIRFVSDRGASVTAQLIYK